MKNALTPTTGTGSPHIPWQKSAPWRDSKSTALILYITSKLRGMLCLKLFFSGGFLQAEAPL
jgi:hypothetical protein